MAAGGGLVNRDVSIRIGGDAGQGVESTGAGFCKALARSGLHVFRRDRLSFTHPGRAQLLPDPCCD